MEAPARSDRFYLCLARRPGASPPGLLSGLVASLLGAARALLGGLVRRLGALLPHVAGGLDGLLSGLACSLHGLLSRLARCLNPGLCRLLGSLYGLLDVLLCDLRRRAQRLLVERHRRVEVLRVGVGPLLAQGLEGLPLALALLLEVLGSLPGALGLVVDLLYPVVEEVLGELEVALLQPYYPVSEHLKRLLGGIGQLLGGLLDVLRLLLIHV